MKKCCVVVLLLLLNVAVGFAETIKAPNVAGGFYPQDPTELTRMVEGDVAGAIVPASMPHVEVAIVPHAGYIYSGPVAGYAFKALANTPYKTIIILAPSHYFPFKGAAIWPTGFFQTPLGNVPVDEALSAEIQSKTTVVKTMPEVFEKEHALEVQLPFIQKTFPHAKIVPILLGDADFNACEQLALTLNAIMGQRKDILVLVSSDMSHYLPYDANDAKDAQTLKAIVDEDIESFWNGNMNRTMEMCGFIPATVGMMMAKLRGLSDVVVLKHANSGDTAGDHSKVVGYASIVFLKPEGLSLTQKKTLVGLARQSLESFVKKGQRISADIKDVRLNQVQGAFVTLTKGGVLRGCIGNIIGQKPLAQTVVDMAIAAASEDPRFPPVKADELKDIHVEVSVLSIPVKINSIDQIKLGRDGVILASNNGHQGVFLPQVATETQWSKEEFLNELCTQKAGLLPQCYLDPEVDKFTFTAEVFDEK